jgi:hypothetical protein
LRPVDPLEISAPAIAERQISEAVERFRQIITEQLPGLNAKLVLRSGRPVEEIIEAKKQVGAEIIVLAKHNRPRLTRMFIDSVAESRGSGCDLHSSQRASEGLSARERIIKRKSLQLIQGEPGIPFTGLFATLARIAPQRRNEIRSLETKSIVKRNGGAIH